MEYKLSNALFVALEDKKKVNMVKKHFAMETEYEKGKRLLLHHENEHILKLASDTIIFWTSDKMTSDDCMVPLLEDKQVVWKFHGSYARKGLQLFSTELSENYLGAVKVKLNQRTRKNVSLVEIFCNYEDYETVNSKIEQIVRAIEELKVKRIKVKSKDKAKARQFIEQKLDNDASVLCIFHEKENELELFAKDEESIRKAEEEFKSGPRTTVMYVNAKTNIEHKSSILEAKNSSPSASSTNSTQKSTVQDEISANAPGLLTSTKQNMKNKNDKIVPPDEMPLTVSNVLIPNTTALTETRTTNSSRAAANTGFRSIGVESGSNFLCKFELNGLKVFIYKHSIVEVKGVDAIVNAANENMVHGGGIAYYISKAAGKTMDDEGRAYVAKSGKVRVGKNCVTGAGMLPYKGIIHAVGPQWSGYVGKEDKCAEDLYETVKGSLVTAENNNWNSIALCAISAGIYGVPKKLCAEMYIKALADFSKRGTGSLREVHFVDVNLEILGMVKDAHEEWRRSPDSIDFKNAFNYPSALGRRPTNNTSYSEAQSLRQTMSAKSVGLSKTKFDGSPVFEFQICGRTIVKLYTGDIVKLDSVDAIVCAIDKEFKGGLAHAIAKAAGQSYQRDIFNASRRKKTASDFEGDVFYCNGGALRVKKIMHILVVNPVMKLTEETLSRLKFLNQRIMEEANINKIQRIGMPLIGCGLLKNTVDIETCSQRLAEDVTEFCKVNQANLNIRELHIVNQDAERTTLLKEAFKLLESQPLVASFTGADVKGKSGYSPSERHGTDRTRETVDQTSLAVRSTKADKTKNLLTSINREEIRCTYCPSQAEWNLKCGHVFCSVCVIPFKEKENCLQCATNADTGTDDNDAKGAEVNNTKGTEGTAETCPVCLCDFTVPVHLPCRHRLCEMCLDQLKRHKPCCPVCNAAFDTVTGTQPKGTMKHKIIEERLPGFGKFDTIMIMYDFPNGKQGKEHPKPGKYYKGTQRHAFLPNNEEGNMVLRLLKVAFDRRLIFTIGDSRTTGKEDRVTWNDIHHKTAIAGGPENFGYPDPDYLTRVKEELAAKGVTEDCLK